MGVINQCSTDSWKDALVAVVTHSGEHMPILCERLADRLLTESKSNDSNAIQNAILCLICAGNVEKLVETWPTVKSIDSTLSSSSTDGGYKEQTKHLQELVEVVMLLQKAVELQGRNVGATGKFADLLSKYAGLLAAQGALNSALTYLGPSDDPEITNLRDRLYYALGHKQAYAAPRVSQTQNLYNKSQQPNQTSNNRFGQQRQSVPNVVPAVVQNQTSFSSYPGAVQQQTASMFNAISPPQSWNNLPSSQQVQSWNAKPIVQQQQPPAAVSSFMPQQQPPSQSKPVGPPPIGDSIMQPARPPSVGSQGKTKIVNFRSSVEFSFFFYFVQLQAHVVNMYLIHLFNQILVMVKHQIFILHNQQICIMLQYQINSHHLIIIRYQCKINLHHLHRHQLQIVQVHTYLVYNQLN